MTPTPPHPSHDGPCTQCVTIHNPANCDGHSRTNNGAQCRYRKGYKTDHPGFGNCKFHLGATANGRAHAQQQQVGALYLALASKGEVQPMTDPFSAIAEMAAERRTWSDAAAELVNRELSTTTLDERGVERVRAVVLIAERMADRAMRAATTMADLDIDERLVSIQRQAFSEALDTFAAAIDRIVERLGHDPEAPEVAQLIELELRRAA